jgi:hypothetical protein
MPPQIATSTSIQFDLLGIAELIKNKELGVPEYQRSYSWTTDKDDQQVVAFWHDLEESYALPHNEYFLGTVVLTSEGDSERRTIIDGQQRLATTSLLLAAIKDELVAASHDKVSVVERDYLAKQTLKSAGSERRLRLNLEDDDYFATILETGSPGTADPKVPSHQRLSDAYFYLRGRLAPMIAADGADELIEFVSFLDERAKVGVIEVPTEADAYTIFETLNDRGADLTIADLLKNYLYGRATADKIAAVRADWNQALGALGLSAAETKFVAFLRHYWSSREGSTTEKRLYGAIKERIRTKRDVTRFAKEVASAASKYAALDNPNHEYWKTVGTAGKSEVELLSRFRLAPNRPLLLAAMDHFAAKELRALLSALVSWSVRGMVAETMNSKSTEEQYCAAAVKIRAGEFKTTAQVRAFLSGVVPSDEVFGASFGILRISKNRGWYARYYLRALERAKAGEAEPELVPNPDETELNLEHVLAQNAEPADWTGITTAEDVATWAYRLGNMVLLTKSENEDVGNGAFPTKKPVLRASQLALTSEVGRRADWGPKQIDERQQRLAKLAVEAWAR